MSLDVYLSLPGANKTRQTGIFIREDGQNREISREEWDRRFPDREPVVFAHLDVDEVYSDNITHNLNRMAGEAGIYEALWRPEELGITTAGQLIQPLTDGLALLQSEPARFQAFNPSNGWGSYEGLVSFVARYLEACREYPTALVRTSR